MLIWEHVPQNLYTVNIDIYTKNINVKSRRVKVEMSTGKWYCRPMCATNITIRKPSIHVINKVVLNRLPIDHHGSWIRNKYTSDMLCWYCQCQCVVSANFNLKQNNTLLGIHAHITWSCYFCYCCYFFLLDSTQQYTLIYMCILRYIDCFKTDTFLNQ